MRKERTTVAGFTPADLQAILDECLPGDDAARLDEGNLDTELADLGYDSLVVAELADRLKDDFHVNIPDDVLDELKTPGALISYVSDRLSAAR
jgi:minimal PKS acyl carrier protein